MTVLIRDLSRLDPEIIAEMVRDYKHAKTNGCSSGKSANFEDGVFLEWWYSN
jgi:hypothetical protein